MKKTNLSRICSVLVLSFLAASSLPVMAAYSDKYVRSVALPKLKGLSKSRVVFLYGAPTYRKTLENGHELFIYGKDPEGSADDCAVHLSYDNDSVADAEIRGQGLHKKAPDAAICSRIIREMIK